MTGFECNCNYIVNSQNIISTTQSYITTHAQRKKLEKNWEILINRLTPSDPYMGRTAPLTSKRCILYIYSTNIGIEYIKHALYSPIFLFKVQFVS